MKIETKLPEWMDRDLTKQSPDVVPDTTGIMHTGSRYLFTGSIGEMLGLRRIPRALEIALDMDRLACVVRIEFEEGGDGENPRGKLRALYTYMEIEGFALLWNALPSEVHGLPGEAITLFLAANETRYPVLIGDGVQGDLFFDEGRFYAAVNPNFLELEANPS